MRFSPPEDTVKLYETGFDDDLLGREKTSKALSEVLEKIEDPLVVALDGRWGTGKSYFLKRWVGAHRLQNEGKALTVYFDAFAHDYLSDPLIALVGALVDRASIAEKPKLDQLKKVAFKFIKPAARIGLAIATYGATEALNGLGDVAVEAAKGEADKAVDDFWQREQGRQVAMAEFRASIQALTKSAEQEEATPLIIVIDELDRCRPDYALEILEVIKHFFSVPIVHFLLGVNLKALENSVKARYGPEIDSTAYLQKFISLYISLPDHIGDHERTLSIIHYVDHIAEQMGTPPHILSEIRMQLEMLATNNHISIRDVGKIMSNAALLPEVAQGNRVRPGWRTATITLIISKVIRPDVFQKLLDVSLSKDDLVVYFGATDDYIKQELENGESNPKFDHQVAIRYSIWRYICSNGIILEEDLPSVNKFFDEFGRADNVRAIPRKIFDEWISVFKVS